MRNSGLRKEARVGFPAIRTVVFVANAGVVGQHCRVFLSCCYKLWQGDAANLCKVGKCKLAFIKS